MVAVARPMPVRVKAMIKIAAKARRNPDVVEATMAAMLMICASLSRERFV